MKINIQNLLMKINHDESIFYTNFIPSWILYNLRNVNHPVKERLLNHIEESRSLSSTWNYHSENIIYPDDLDDTFSALIALYKNKPESLNGNTLAKITQLLLLQDKGIGGPYKTWINWESSDIDPVVNSTILYFLSMLNIDMPNLVKYIDDSISNNIDSKYYKSKLIKYYFYTRNYLGNNREWILLNLEKIKIRSKLDAALKANIYLNFKMLDSAIECVEYFDQEIPLGNELYVEKITKEKTIFMRSNSCTYSIMIEALSRIDNEKKRRMKNSNVQEDLLERAIMYGTEAYSLFDKICDEGFEPSHFFKGLGYMRNSVSILEKVSEKEETRAIIKKCLDETEKANLWECMNNRVMVSNGQIDLRKNIKIKRSLYYGKKSLALAIQKIVLEDKPYNEFLYACTQVQCLRQMSDDTRDWFTDLQNGHITPANISCYRFLRRKYKNNNLKADINSEKKNMAVFFWKHSVKSIINLFDWHLKTLSENKYFKYFEKEFDFYSSQKEKISIEEKCMTEFSIVFPVLNQACTNLDHTALGRDR